MKQARVLGERSTTILGKTRARMVGGAALVFLLMWGSHGVAQDSQEKQSGERQVIEVSAKKYEFSPSEIHVKKGGEVRLKVHSTDEDHGMTLNLYPEGSKDKSAPGLVFDNPQDNGKVEKGQDQVLDFTAQRAGTYKFKCAKICGIHHGRMKGELIVEE
jgi:cytochrome c oxidase subunit 2